LVDHRGSGHLPVAVAAAAEPNRRLQAHAQGQQVLDFDARPAPLFVELVQQDVCQQWREWSGNPPRRSGLKSRFKWACRTWFPDRETWKIMASIRSPQQLGDALRAARKQLGLTQPQLALAAGVGVRFMVDLEAGKPTLRLENVLRVIDALGGEVHVSGLPSVATDDHREGDAHGA
jgi:y4mF family transcriptional regulator